MNFESKENPGKVGTKYLYDNEDAHEATGTVIVNSDNVVIGKNEKPYLVGLSNTRNTPIKSETGLSMFHAEEIEVDGVTHWYYTK